MKKLKQILAILVIGTLLFTACDNRDEVEEISSCNYTFTATPATQNFILGSVNPVSITLNIAKQSSNVSCDTKYMMAPVISGGTLGAGAFTYSGANDMPIGNSTGTFTATAIGTYTIKFTVTNTGADTNVVQVKEVTINVTYPPIVITPNTGNTIDTVYAKQTANYEFDLSGGDSGNTDYEIKVVADASTLNSVLEINGVEVSFDSNPLVIVSSNFTIKLTPNDIEATTTATATTETPTPTNFTLTVRQTDVAEVTEPIVLNAKMPRFDTTIKLGNNAVDSTDPTAPVDTIDSSSSGSDGKSKLEVWLNLLDGYNHNLNYDYTINGNVNIDDNDFSGTTNATGTGSDNEPDKQEFEIKALTTPSLGDKEIIVTVENEYGYKVTKSIYIHID